MRATDPPGETSSLVVSTSAADEPARALLTVIDEAIEAQRELEHQVRARLHINNTDFRALMLVHRRGRRGLTTRPREITRDLGVSTSATAQIIGRLGRAGLLTRSPDPDDARGGLLALTDHTRTELTDTTAGLRADIDELVETLEASEERRVIELLDRVQEILQRHSTALSEPARPADAGPGA